MITSNLMGGLGNHMFQISVAYSLSLDNGDECAFDPINSSSKHGQIDSYKSNIYHNINFGSVPFNSSYSEPQFSYTKIPYEPNTILLGYYQSEKYFSHNRDKVLSLFGLDEVSRTYINNKYSELLKGKTCSLHVRRGDYLKLPNHHPVCSLEYYQSAIELIGDDTTFLVFSNDIGWCQENFNGDNFIFINESDYIDMWLMSLCDDNIIANSSFSWWGAWLNPNPNKKVTVPKRWFGPAISNNTEDLIPNTWIVI